MSYARHSDSAFPVRRQAFDFAQVPPEWVRGDLLSSCFFMSLMASFPDGEQFFIRSVRALRDLVSDRQQQANISAFIGQEAVHGQQHGLLNDHLSSQGFDIAALLERVNALLDAGEQNLSERDRLTITAALEHLTAVLAKNYLANPVHRKRFQAKEIAQLLDWHALEESEHKAVAFDVMREAGVSYGKRATLMLSSSLALVTYLAWAAPHLYTSKTGRRPKLRDYLRLGNTLLGRDGFVRQMIPDYLQWFRPGFHPDHAETAALEAEAKTRLAALAA